MLKKMLVLFLVVVSLLIAGCNSNLPAPETQPTTSPVVTEPTQTEPEPTQTEPEQTQSEETAGEGVTPLLYKVTDSDGDMVWLFGSIHVGQEDFYPLPEYVMEAYRGSDALAVELDVIAFEKNYLAQIRAMKSFVYTDGTQITDHISKMLYEDAVEILEENDMYSQAMDSYLPAMWFMMVDNATFFQMGLDAELGIDRHLLKMAKEDEKTIREIESAEFQYEMLSGFSEPLQILLLESSVLSYRAPLMAKAQLMQTVKSWSTGDEESLTKEFRNEQNQYLPIEERALLAEYNKAMYTDRNNAMTQYAVDALDAGEELFICVGAAHVIGDGAMVEQLKELGYAVEIVS